MALDPEDISEQIGDEEDDDELPMENVETPLETDVLCGRGGAALRHPGNQTYRTLVQLNKGLYTTCLKAEKLKISKSIVAAIREQKGRFLEKDTKKGTWCDIGDKKAVEKTSQALREGQPKLRQKIAEMGGNPAALLQEQQQQYGGGRAQRQPSYTDAAMAPAAAFAAQQQQLHIQMPPPPMSSPGAGVSSSFNPRTSGELMPPPQDILNRLSLSDIQEDGPSRMRPSMLQRGSVIAHELGVDPQLSRRSLMSDFSDYGISDSMLDLESPTNRSTVYMAGDIQESAAAAAASMAEAAAMEAAAQVEEPPPPQKPSALPNFDRRKSFARMKYSRMPSGRMNMSGRLSANASLRSLGDGMPEIHMVESNMSLISNFSSVGDVGGGVTPSDGGLAAESRRSIMSGLSRISDATGGDANSIFSDLSKKIGNVSTRSMAMSEISIMDDVDSVEDTTPDKQTSPPQPMTSYSLEYE